MAPLRCSTILGFSVFLAAAFASARASAADYSVSPSGSDSASGQSGAPWLTIQHALKTVKAGDSVTVEDGTYAGLACDTVSGTASAPIVFRSRNKWGAKITSATSGSSQDWVQFSSCSYITFDGFEVSGATRSGIAILGNTDDGSDARGVVIQNCYSHNNGGTTVSGRHDGIFSGFALDLTIQDNTIDTTGEHGIYVSNSADNPSILRNTVSNTGANCIQINADVGQGGDGLISNWRIEGNQVSNCKGAAAVNLDGAIQGVAVNNVIYNASNGGFTFFQGDGAAASHDNLIANNTVYDPSGSRSAIQIADGADNNVVFNNIFITKSAALEIQTAANLKHDYNIVSGFDGGSAAAHETTVSVANAAALFAGASSGNLQLAAGSAAIDTGVASYGGSFAPATDVLGAARPAGGSDDLGAYESGSTTPATGTGGGNSVGTGGAGGTRAAGTGGTGARGGSGGKAGGTGGKPGGIGGVGGKAPGTGGNTGSAGNTGAGGGTGRPGDAGGNPATGTGGNPATGTGGNPTTGTGGNPATGAGGKSSATGPTEIPTSSGCSCDAADATARGLTLEIIGAAPLLLALSRRRRSRIS